MEHAGERNKLLKNRKWCLKLKLCGALAKSPFSPLPTPPSFPSPGSSNKSFFQPKTSLLFISLCLLLFNLYFYWHISFIYFALTLGRKGEKICLDSSWFPLNFSIYSFPHQDQSSAVSLPRDLQNLQNAVPAPIPWRFPLRGYFFFTLTTSFVWSSTRNLPLTSIGRSRAWHLSLAGMGPAVCIWLARDDAGHRSALAESQGSGHRGGGCWVARGRQWQRHVPCWVYRRRCSGRDGCQQCGE